MEDMDPDKETTKNRVIQPCSSLESPLWELTLLQQIPVRFVLLEGLFVCVFWIATLEIYYLQVGCIWYLEGKFKKNLNW